MKEARAELQGKVAIVTGGASGIGRVRPHMNVARAQPRPPAPF